VCLSYAFYEFIAIVRFENSYIQMSFNNVDYETDSVFTLCCGQNTVFLLTYLLTILLLIYLLQFAAKLQLLPI